MLSFNNTRLDITQRHALTLALNNINATVYLFGSRTNLQSKGGDVDILLLLNDEKENDFKTMLEVSKKYQSNCDEKIDVLVYPPADKLNEEQRIFFNSIDKICLTV